MITKQDIETLNILRNLKNGVSNNNGLPIRTKYEDGTLAFVKSIKQQYRVYNKENPPLTLLRPLAMRSAINEMRWIYQLQSNRLKDAESLGINWWSKWETKKKGYRGTIGEAYGYVVREYRMIERLLAELEHNPQSRRHIMNLWQEKHVRKQDQLGGLNPCAYETIWSVDVHKNKRVVNCHLNQRSMDTLVTYCINPFQYYCLALMVCSHLTWATEITHELGNFSHFVMDMHIYDRHEPLQAEILQNFELINLSDIQNFEISIKEPKCFFDITAEDFNLPYLHPFKPTNKIELAL